jgi:hypothetical protein
MPSHHLNDTDKGSQTLFLHSTDAVISVSDAEKIFYLNEAVYAPAGYRILIGLTNMTLPNAMYNVTSSSNNIVIAGATYTITAGNYSAEDLATALTTAINSATGGTVSFNETNSNFTFTFSSGKIINSSTLERQLGLKGQMPTASVTSYTGTNICDLGGVTNIYVRIRNLTMNNLDSKGRVNNIIASIVNNTNYGGYIFFVPPEVLYYQVSETNINHLDIQLTDQEGTVLDLNGADFNITLTIHFVKQRETSFRSSLLREIKERYKVPPSPSSPKNREPENKK